MVLRDGAGSPRWADKEGFRGTAAVSVPEAHVLTYTVSVTAFQLHKWAHMAPGVSRLGLPLACRPFLPATLGSPRGSLLPLLKGAEGICQTRLSSEDWGQFLRVLVAWLAVT